MHSVDQRDYYRIEDRVHLAYQVVHRNHPANSHPADFFDTRGAFMLLRDLYQLQLESAELLRSVTGKDRELGALFQNLARRVDLIGQAMVAPEAEDLGPALDVGLGEGGLSFPTGELLSVGTSLVCKLLFERGHLGIVTFAEVRHCRLRDDGERYTAGVRFIGMDETSRQLLARHIIHEQALARRERLRRDAFESD